MNDIEITERISRLTDIYFSERTEKIVKESNSVRIRMSLNKRVGEYFPKSLLNEILVKKGFKYEKINESEYYFNISEKDILLLSNSSEILKKIKTKHNYPFYDIVKLRKFKNVDYFKYVFKYLIKLNLSNNLRQLDFSEKMAYCVLAKEIGISPSLMFEYIEILNDDRFPKIPDKVLKQLLKLFDLKFEDCITNNSFRKK